MAGQGSHASNFSTNYIHLPYDYQVVMAVLGATDPHLRPHICPYCEKSFRNSQALGGHLSSHRKRTKEASQPEKVNNPRNQHLKVTVAPKDHGQMAKKHGFNLFGECYARRNTQRRMTRKEERSSQLVDYMGVLKHGEAIQTSLGDATPASKLMPLAKFVQEEKPTLDGGMASSNDGIDLTLKL